MTAETVDQPVKVDNALYNLAHILDLDGSGTLELIIPSAKLGLWGYLRLLTTHKASFAFNTVAHDGEAITAARATAMTASIQCFTAPLPGRRPSVQR